MERPSPAGRRVEILREQEITLSIIGSHLHASIAETRATYRYICTSPQVPNRSEPTGRAVVRIEQNCIDRAFQDLLFLGELVGRNPPCVSGRDGTAFLRPRDSSSPHTRDSCLVRSSRLREISVLGSRQSPGTTHGEVKMLTVRRPSSCSRVRTADSALLARSTARSWY